MKIIQVHNWHRYMSGSDIVPEVTTRMLKRRDHDVSLVTRDSRELGRGMKGKLRAFACGIYSPSGRRIIASHIHEFKPDLVHVHELYPFFSPWILVDCRQARIPVIITCHDYGLTCPIFIHMRNGRICELCVGGREYWCVLKNCRGNILESIAYASRNSFGRVMQLYHKNVTLFIALTQFAKNRLIDAGFEDDRIAVLPNSVPLPKMPIDPSNGEYAAYVGRISSEKGIDTLLSAASCFPEVFVQLAGDGPDLHKLKKKVLRNTRFLGRLDFEQLSTFYRKARFVIIPSMWFEGCPMVLMEAMAQGLPVIASRIGGIPEIVEDGVTGLLFEPGNAEDLANKIRLLWDDRDLCRQMGHAAREKVIWEYSEDVYYERLIAMYKRAIEIEMRHY